jgi:mediator of RNA polymerase II transcription subunit 5
MVAVIDNATVQQAIMKGNTPKGTGNRLSRALANFISLLQHAPAIVERLQVFHTQTLVTIQPVDKKEMTASKEIDEMLGQGIELVPDDVTVSDIPIVQSRAGLYIYFNALVSSCKCGFVHANYLIACWKTFDG